MATKKKSNKSSRGHIPSPQRQKTPTRRDGPLLSIGMIFRDDIRCIEKCLTALQPLREAVPCELVMADTGSVDGSRAIAERFADILFEFPWVKDFSAARNAVMDKCSGLWFLTVDTDEYLDEDFSQLVEFLNSETVGEFEYGYVIQRNYITYDMAEGDYSDFYAGRMCRMGTGWRYEGSIHESWPVTYQARAIELPGLVLHHDGYAMSKMKNKNKRNMELLEQELEKDPGDMRRVIQCIESVHTNADARKYCNMALELLKKEQPHYVSIAAYADVITVAGKREFSELEEWTAQARERFPDSMRIELAASYYCAARYGIVEASGDPKNSSGKLERCLEELERYWAAIRRFDAGDFDHVELYVGTADTSAVRSRQVARVLHADVCVRLKRWGEALEHLAQMHPDKLLDSSLLGAMMNCLLRLWGKSEADPLPLLRRYRQELDEDSSSQARQRRETFLGVCRQAFVRPEEDAEDDEEADLRPTHLLFAGLGEGCDLGRAGLILAGEDAQEAQRLLDAVEDWRFFPPEAVNQALKLGAKLPGSFWRMKSEAMGLQAAGLFRLRKEEPVELLKLWDEEFEKGMTPGQVLWLFCLANTAVQGVDWKENGSRELFELFCSRSARYMEGFLNPAVCTEEYINLQPAITRFGWYCVQARTARDGGDLVGYTRWLKKGLLSAPEMKEMVDYLSQEVRELAAEQPAPEPPPELLALAEQVRTILAGFPPEDPAVTAIKQSPAYQKVAHLLE